MKKVYVLFLLPAFMIIAGLHSFAQTTSGTLPVLISVNADLTENNKVAVSWTILQKVNTDCFEVEKSNDGIRWWAIAIIKADNSAAVPFSYSMLDISPLHGTNFYRVRIKDLNGNSGLTPVKNVYVNAIRKTSIYPNPSSSQVNIQLGRVPVSDWHISLFNGQGQMVTQKKISKSVTHVQLPVSDYAAGNYVLEITENNARQINTLMINHN